MEIQKKLNIIEVYVPIIGIDFRKFGNPLTDAKRIKSNKGFPRYSVSNYGNVKNNQTGRILKPDVGGRGYLGVLLSNNKTKCHKIVHKLVAEAFLFKPEDKKCVDHINGNKLDNSLFNLRWCTHGENNQNSIIPSNNTSGVKGVCFSKRRNKWLAYIRCNRKQIYIGYYDDLEEAKIARQGKSTILFGKFKNKCEK